MKLNLKNGIAWRINKTKLYRFFMPDKSVHFYLVHPKKEKSAIYVRFYYYNRELACTTGVSIETRFWDSKKQAPRRTAPNYTTYKIYLARIEEIIMQYYNKCFEEGQLPTPEEIRLHLRSTLQTKAIRLRTFWSI